MKSDHEYVLDDKDKPEEIEQETKCSIQSKLNYILIVTVIVFVAEIFIREPLTNFSDYVQENLNFPYKCELGDYLVWFKYKGKAVIFLFLFNISNIFVSLSLILLDSFGIFITGTIKLIYLDPRPFWRNENLVPCTCATNYGSPSTTGLDIFLVCIVVYRGLINRSSNKWWKFMTWCFFIIPQALAWISRFIQNLHTIHQLVFGAACGYIIQYFYFEILEIDMNSSKQLKKLVNNTWLLATILITIVSWVFFNAIHYYFVEVHEKKYILKNISNFCSLDMEFYLFDNESYQKTAKIFCFIGAIVGVMFEFWFVFDGDFDRYDKYNMGENRWSETDGTKTVLRMALMFILGKLLLRLPKWGSIKRDEVFDLIISKCIVKNFFKGFFYFYIVKVAFRWCGVSNENSKAVENCSSNLLKSDDENKETLLKKNKVETK